MISRTVNQTTMYTTRTTDSDNYENLMTFNEFVTWKLRLKGRWRREVSLYDRTSHGNAVYSFECKSSTTKGKNSQQVVWEQVLIIRFIAQYSGKIAKVVKCCYTVKDGEYRIVGLYGWPYFCSMIIAILISWA